MIVTADKYEKLLTSKGAGSWGRLDFEGDYTNLRVLDVRQMDGSPRIYFDGKREQILTGIRYQPVGRIPYRLMSGYCYKFMTHVEFVKPLPKEMTALVMSVQDMSDAAVCILSAPMTAGYKGSISFNVLAFRSLEIDQMSVVGRLVIFDGTIPIVEKEPEPKAPKEKKVKEPKEKEDKKKDEDSTPGKSENGGEADS